MGGQVLGGGGGRQRECGWVGVWRRREGPAHRVKRSLGGSLLKAFVDHQYECVLAALITLCWDQS